MNSTRGSRRKKTPRLMGKITAVIARAASSRPPMENRRQRQNVPHDERTVAYKYRSGMQAALRETRLIAYGERARQFFAELGTLVDAEEKRFQSQEIGDDYIQNIEETRASALTQEIQWLSLRTSYFSDKLSTYLRFAASIEESIRANGEREALEQIAKLNSELGRSLWSLQLEFALVERIQGTKAQKNQLQEIKRKHKKGILPFLSTFFSRNAESAVSVSWYRQNSERRLSGLAPSNLKKYLAYKIIGDWPQSDDDTAAVLAMEQNFHEIDIYETYISALQHLAIRQSSDIRREFLRDAISELPNLGDFRVTKLKMVLGGANSGTHKVPFRISETVNLIKGSLPKAYRSAVRDEARGEGRSLARLMTLASCIQLAGRKSSIPRFRSNSIRDLIVRSLTSVLNHGRASQDSEPYGIEWLSKLGHIYRSMPFALALGFLAQSNRTSCIGEWLGGLMMCSLNSAEFAFIDFIAFPPDGLYRKSLSALLSAEHEAEEYAATLLTTRLWETHPDFSSLIRGLDLLRGGSADLAQAAIQRALASPSRAVSSHAALIALECYAETGNLRDAVWLATREVVGNHAGPAYLPLDALFHEVTWRELAPIASLLETSIALFLFSQLYDVERIQTYRRFALEEYLTAMNIRKPSELRPLLAARQDARVAFFIGRVCTKELLDMLPAISGTKAVFEERRELCALLVSLALDTDGEYQQELLDISGELIVQGGLRVIDGTRVHIDVPALKAISKRQLHESFSRYVSLIKEGIGIGEDFDTVLRGISKAETSAKYNLAVAANEADELLVSMIMQCRELFLFNSPHGLDSYLSKRVRHGSIIGHLRAPVEEEGLITQQARDGSYNQNVIWTSKFPVFRAELSSAFAAFAKSFDSYLVWLKDVLLHVKSETHPLGIFDAPLANASYYLIRSLAARDRSIETLVETIYASLWGLLNPSLERAKKLLQEESSVAIGEQFALFRARVIELVPPCQERSELDTSIGRASQGCQHQISIVSSWFNPIGPGDCIYSINDIVRIVQASVRAISSRFDPKIVVDSTQILEIAAANLPVIADVLFLIFDNVARWSTAEAHPEILVFSHYDETEELLAIRVENSGVNEADIFEGQKKIAEKKRVLAVGAYTEAARVEGNSGLFKLAGITAQSVRGELDFGYLPGNRFFVSVVLGTACIRKK